MILSLLILAHPGTSRHAMQTAATTPLHKPSCGTAQATAQATAQTTPQVTAQVTAPATAQAVGTCPKPHRCTSRRVAP